MIGALMWSLCSIIFLWPSIHADPVPGYPLPQGVELIAELLFFTLIGGAIGGVVSAGIGAVIGLIYAALLIVLQRYTFSPLENSERYGLCALLVMGVPAGFLCFVSLVMLFPFMFIVPEVVIMIVLWIAFIAWRLMAIHQRFIRRYFGTVDKQKQSISHA